VIDLMEALKRSLNASQQAKAAPKAASGKKRAGRRKAA
jgi:non-homologous end joining protein Ku